MAPQREVRIPVTVAGHTHGGLGTEGDGTVEIILIALLGSLVMLLAKVFERT